MFSCSSLYDAYRIKGPKPVPDRDDREGNDGDWKGKSITVGGPVQRIEQQSARIHDPGLDSAQNGEGQYRTQYPAKRAKQRYLRDHPGQETGPLMPDCSQRRELGQALREVN